MPSRMRSCFSLSCLKKSNIHFTLVPITKKSPHTRQRWFQQLLAHLVEAAMRAASPNQLGRSQIHLLTNSYRALKALTSNDAAIACTFLCIHNLTAVLQGVRERHNTGASLKVRDRCLQAFVKTLARWCSTESCAASPTAASMSAMGRPSCGSASCSSSSSFVLLEVAHFLWIELDGLRYIHM